MGKIIRCSAALEPPGYFDGYAVSVQLNADYKAADGEPDAEEHARDWFEEFLGKLADDEVRFAAYALDALGPPKLKLIPGTDINGWLKRLSHNPKGDIGEQIGNWLGANAAHWAVDPPVESLPDDDQLPAGYLLAGSEGWMSPIPQLGGLTQVFELGEFHDSPFFVVPQWGKEQPEQEIAIEAAQAEGVEENNPSLANGERLIVVGIPVERCELIGTVDEPEESLLIGDDGFVIKTPDMEAVADLLARIREAAGSSLWTAPQLLEVRWASDERDDDASTSKRVNRLIWRALNGALSLLDPVIAALLVPASDRDGPFLSALMAARNDKAIIRGDEKLKEDEQAVTELKRKLNERTKAWETDTTVLTTDLASILQLDLVAARAALDRLPKLTPSTAPIGLPHALSAILVAHRDKIDLTWLTASQVAQFEAQLSGELRELIATFQEEAGLERAVVQLVDIAIDETDPNWTTPFRIFKQWLAEEFDGHAAARHAVGGLVQRDLLRAASSKAKEPISKGDIEKSLREAIWFTDRLRLTKSGTLLDLAKALPVAAPHLIDGSEGELRRQLQANFEAVVDEITTRASKTARFMPDAAPRPLPVMIAIDQDLSDDGFSQRYDGVCLLIRREDPGDRWAYANLARIENPTDHLSLLATRPVASDGFSQMFIDYSGEPFTWAGSKRADGIGPFIEFRAPTKDDFDAMARLPALAYGKDYSVAAFAVSRSGVLPHGIASDDKWLPKAAPSVPAAAISDLFPYRRGTAIASPTLALKTPSSLAVIDQQVGVQPLSRDYPRLGCISSAPNEPRRMDLWRLPTGEGSIDVPVSEARILLAEVRLWGGSSFLTLELCRVDQSSGKYHEQAIATWNVRAKKALEGAIEFKLGRDKDGQPTATATLSPGDGWTLEGPATSPLSPGESLWLRLTVTAEAGPMGLSLSDPRAEQLAGKESGQLVLLAPDEPGWLAPTKRQVMIAPPCMSLKDFDRWVSNSKLREAAGDAEPVESSPLLAFLKKLLADHLAITEPSKANRDGERDSVIPEIAVSGLLVELCPLDALATAEVGQLLQIIPIEKLGTALKDVSTKPLPDILEHLRNVYSFGLEIGSGKKLELNKIDAGSANLIASIPSGCNARISVRPLVDARYFEAGDLQAFNERYAELQQGKFDQYLIFDGPALTVEVMTRLPKLPDQTQADELLSIRAGTGVRAYDLVWRGAAESDEHCWRHFGQAEITTQRWRYLGRPIYRWFEPRKFAVKPDPGSRDPNWSADGPVLRLERVGRDWIAASPSDGGPILDFERDAFLDRNDPDDGLREVVVLRPRGSETVLQALPWEEPSATMFRHRVRLISRYAAMMQTPMDGSWDVYSDKSKAGDWLRAVVLADAAKAQLTRPQLRALMPLAVPLPDEEPTPADVPTPPVLAVLEEPPMNVGGLAERIGAEVRSGFGYAFDRVPDGTLGLKDARKEFGPDPRYGYFPTPTHVEQALTLAVEGPMGLTFEAEVSTPAFPHSALLLEPRFLAPEASKHDAQEHFLSIALRRYLDPAWVVRQATVGNEPTWIRVPKTHTLKVKVEGADQNFVIIERDESGWKVSVHPQWIMPETSLENAIDLATIDDANVDHLALLNQPLEEGRFTMSVFAVRKEDGSPANGAAHPMMLASFDWRTGPKGGALNTEQLEHERVGASIVTAMNWTRTRRNALKIVARDQATQVDNAEDVGALRIRMADGTGEKHLLLTDGARDLWPRPAQMHGSMPLYVHRHLAVLISELSGYAGRPLEIHRSANLVLGKNLPGTFTDSPRQLRFVELELPARPLGAGLHDRRLADEFERAVFDLAAVKNSVEDPSIYMVWIRPLGPARRLNAGWIMTLSLTDPHQGASSVTIDPKLTSDRAIEQIVIRWDTTKKAHCDLLWADGETSQITNIALAPDGVTPSPPVVSVGNVVIAGQPVPGEWWADVSMLVLPVNGSVSGDVPLCWDWLFTGGAEVPTEAVRHQALRQMTEAQARVVAVSPPIPIESTTSSDSLSA